MKLGGQRQSTNVEDRRGGGGRGRVAITGGTIVVVLIISAVTGVNPLTLLGVVAGAGRGVATSSGTSSGTSVPANDEGAVFVRQVLATTEDAWGSAAGKLGVGYREPKLVLFRDEVASACGLQSAAVGPFYCPADERAYLDLDFFDQLRDRFHAAGDFAAGYVIAHEIGHHVQRLAGKKAVRGGRELGPSGNTVRVELQADCYAGVWGAYVKKKGLLDAGDVDEALRAAQAIGDDTLQRRARGHVTPESFSHGTSAQRVRWFKRGMDSGDPTQCDTFNAPSL